MRTRAHSSVSYGDNTNNNSGGMPLIEYVPMMKHNGHGQEDLQQRRRSRHEHTAKHRKC